MTFEKEKIRPTSKDKQTMFELRGIPTYKILWFVAKRHKTGLWATAAIVFGVLYLVPGLPSMISSIWN